MPAWRYGMSSRPEPQPASMHRLAAALDRSAGSESTSGAPLGLRPPGGNQSVVELLFGHRLSYHLSSPVQRSGRHGCAFTGTRPSRGAANEREHDPVELFPVDLAPSAQESLSPEACALCHFLGRYVAGHGVEADTGEPGIRGECPPSTVPAHGLGGEALPTLVRCHPVTNIPVARTPHVEGHRSHGLIRTSTARVSQARPPFHRLGAFPRRR